jgi:polyisoprenoid-binding protein YceI
MERNIIMRKINLVAVFLLLSSISLMAQTQWSLDKSHSKVGFSVSHLVITDVDGYFKDYEATVTTNSDDFSSAQVNFSVNTTSIFTDNEGRDKHLRSDDFFNSEKFPKMTFVGKSMKKTSDNKYKLVGDLTIRDVTKQVELDVKYNGMVKDPWGNTKAGFKVTGEINRFDYNLKWNKAIETGSLVVGKEVELVIDLQLIKKS